MSDSTGFALYAGRTSGRATVLLFELPRASPWIRLVKARLPGDRVLFAPLAIGSARLVVAMLVPNLDLADSRDRMTFMAMQRSVVRELRLETAQSSFVFTSAVPDQSLVDQLAELGRPSRARP